MKQELSWSIPLHDSGLFVSAVNPKLIKDYGNNSLRRVKTDKADSRKIARYGLDNWVELRQHTPMDTIRYQLKTMNRQYSLYSKSKVSMKNNLISLLDQTFPGANKLFDEQRTKAGHIKWVDFVRRFWHKDCVAASSLSTFADTFQKWCKRTGYHYSLSDAERIHGIARNSVATLTKNDSTKLIITQAVDSLNAVYDTLQILRSEMQHLASMLPEYEVVMAMQGAGPITGPQLMAEIGDVRRFDRKQSLVAFAGVDAPPCQSGTFESKNRHISKRGSPRLRKTLFQVMSTIIQHAPTDDPVFQFLDRKRREGKHYYVYMTAAANKFLRIYYGTVMAYLKKL